MPSRVPQRKTKISLDGKGSRVTGGLPDPTEEVIGPPPPPPPPPWPPSNAVLVTPSSNLDTLVSVNPSGTVFAIENGVYNRSAIFPLKGGNKYIGNPNNRPIFRGPGINATPFIATTVAGVQMDNIIAEYFGPYDSTDGGAMIHALGGANNWSLTYCEFRWTANSIVRWNSGWVMDRCYLHHSGRYCMGGGGKTGDKLFKNGEWSHVRLPNIPGLPQSTSSNSGGCKFALTSNITLENLYVHDSGWNGIWFDIQNENMVIRNPRIENIHRTAIFIEVSYGPCLIENPYIRNVNLAGLETHGEPPNYVSPAAILVSSTPDVTVVNPDISGAANGISLLEWAHPQILGEKDGQPFGTLDPTRVGLENFICTGGKVSNVSQWAAGKLLNKQASTRPGCPTAFVGIQFDAGAQFRWNDEYPLTEAQFLAREPC